MKLADNIFEAEVLKSDQPVLVDFFSDTCPPCKLLAPMMDKLAKAYEGRAKVYKADIYENSAAGKTYGINAVPTILLFNGGQLIKKWVGLQKEQAFTEALDAQLSNEIK